MAGDTVNPGQVPKSKGAAPALPPPDISGPLVDADNAAPGYAAYRQQVSADDLINEARSEVGGGAAGAPAPGIAAPASPGAAAAVVAPGAETPAAAVPDPMAAPPAAAAPGVAPPAEAQPLFPGGPMPAPAGAQAAQDQLLGSMGIQPQGGRDVGVIPVIKDVARGIPEIPRALWRGLVKNASSMISSATEFETYLQDLTPEEKAALSPPGLPLAAAADLMPKDWLQKWDAAVKAAPDVIVAPPQTVTGNLIAGATQFIATAGRAAGLVKALGAGEKLATAGGGAISMMTAFEGSEDTLAELVQSNPKLANPVTEFLASKPGDSEAEKRLKNGIEGVLTGGVVDAFIGSLKFLKTGREAGLTAPKPQQGATPAPSPLELPPLAPERDFLLLGDGSSAGSIVTVTPKGSGPVAKIGAAMEKTGGVDQGAAASGLAKDADQAAIGQTLGVPVDYGNKSIYVNFAKINAPEDVKLALGQMTEAFGGDIDAAARGVRSNAATQQAADALGMDVADVLKRRNGQPFNAEEALAARQLLAASGERLLEAARKAATPGATPADQFVFRKMMATHYAIQAEVIGARTETARALQSWSIPAGGGQEQMKALEQMLQGTGGTDVSQAMAKRLALLAESGLDAKQLNAAIRKGAFATTMDAVKEIWINGLLSSPTTHIVNSVSNLNVAFQQIYERGVAAQISKATGSGGVADGEATAMLYGALSGVKDAFRLAGRTLIGKDGGELLGGMTKMEARDPAVSAKAFNLDEAGGIGRTVDYLGNVLRVPGRALETQDAFFKSIGYRMELNAQAYRQAASEGLEGPALGKRVAQIVADPPENIRLSAADAALYNTFTNETGAFGKNLIKLRNGGGALNPMPFIIPFVRTPINIARYSFERTPLAPLVGQWRADIAAGGARKDIALARMATGSATMAVASDLAMQGMVSGRGPDDPAERATLQREGWKPYSVKIGDKWYSYNRMDPFGQTLGFAADMTEAMRRGDIDPSDVDEWNEVMAGGIAAVSQFTVNKTYLSGVADFMNVMSDPDRYGRDYVDNWAASFVPFTSALGAAERIGDPTQRQANTPMEAIQAKIPGLSAKLQPRVDLWGNDQKPDAIYGKAFDALTPVQVSKEKHAPIDDEMLKQRIFVTGIPKKTDFEGVPVNFRDWPEVYTAYQKLAGNGTKDPAFGLGAKDFLDQVVSGKSPLSEVYKMGSDGPDGGKSEFIKSSVQQYRQLARQEILADPKFKAFAAFIKDQQDAKFKASLPQGVPASPPPAAPGGGGAVQLQ